MAGAFSAWVAGVLAPVFGVSAAVALPWVAVASALILVASIGNAARNPEKGDWTTSMISCLAWGSLAACAGMFWGVPALATIAVAQFGIFPLQSAANHLASSTFRKQSSNLVSVGGRNSGRLLYNAWVAVKRLFDGPADGQSGTLAPA